MSVTTISVNGRAHEVTGDVTLLRALRDEVGLTSVKQGCDDSTCGTCLIIAGGNLVKACNRPASTFGAQPITTVDGLGERERAAFVEAFVASGAAQCGFCTPAMVLAGTALLARNPSPTRADAVRAIRTNTCRCTGYGPILDAILRAGDLLGAPQPLAAEPTAAAGLDAAKVTGAAVYADDVRLPGMVFARALRSPSPRGLVRELRLDAARAHPHCLAILTAEDVPTATGAGGADRDVLIRVGAFTRYIGDAIALVASDDEAEPVCTPREALEPSAPRLHVNGNVSVERHIAWGDVDEALAGAVHAVTRVVETPWHEHAFMEPECAVAEPFTGPFTELTNGTITGAADDARRLRLHVSSDHPDEQRRHVAAMLGLPLDRVSVGAVAVGGDFGGKREVTVAHHAALMAWHLGRPVKVKLTRAESMRVHAKRPPMELTCTLACDAEGRLVALRSDILADAGAYTMPGSDDVPGACETVAGAYAITTVDVVARAVHTNNIPAGPSRAGGLVQATLALESGLNDLAEQARLDPWEIRRRNVVRDPDGSVVQLLDAVAEEVRADPTAGFALASDVRGAERRYAAALVTLNARGHVERVVITLGGGVEAVVPAVRANVVGGVAMGLGYALTEEFVLDRGVPATRYGKLGVLRADKMPHVEVRVVGVRPGPDPADAAAGEALAELALAATVPAVAHAYSRRDGAARDTIPLRATGYQR